MSALIQNIDNKNFYTDILFLVFFFYKPYNFFLKYLVYNISESSNNLALNRANAPKKG